MYSSRAISTRRLLCQVWRHMSSAFSVLKKVATTADRLIPSTSDVDFDVQDTNIPRPYWEIRRRRKRHDYRM